MSSTSHLQVDILLLARGLITIWFFNLKRRLFPLPLRITGDRDLLDESFVEVLMGKTYPTDRLECWQALLLLLENHRQPEARALLDKFLPIGEFPLAHLSLEAKLRKALRDRHFHEYWLDPEILPSATQLEIENLVPSAHGNLHRVRIVATTDDVHEDGDEAITYNIHGGEAVIVHWLCNTWNETRRRTCEIPLEENETTTEELCDSQTCIAVHEDGHITKVLDLDDVLAPWDALSVDESSHDNVSHYSEAEWLVFCVRKLSLHCPKEFKRPGVESDVLQKLRDDRQARHPRLAHSSSS